VEVFCHECPTKHAYLDVGNSSTPGWPRNSFKNED
jgi:hypothetical protein